MDSAVVRLGARRWHYPRGGRRGRAVMRAEDANLQVTVLDGLSSAFLFTDKRHYVK